MNSTKLHDGWKRGSEETFRRSNSLIRESHLHKKNFRERHDMYKDIRSKNQLQD